eukprot:TRINITY_DN19768_c0_g1_i1.p1 TRINITY_DN19768_c0_g1~~TRINITY_DN19768_c0_g1_i1.p1  ORF type:complete len:224 (+),score=27.09 TRINITY_DN19768_c0_g1_i1:114-785(+)
MVSMQVAFDAHLPSVLGTGALPEQELRFSELLSFKRWQGIAWIKTFYRMLVLLNTLLWIVVMIVGYINGGVGLILLSTFVVPVLWFVSIVGSRIGCEVLLSLLLQPTLLSTNYTRLQNSAFPVSTVLNNANSRGSSVSAPAGVGAPQSGSESGLLPPPGQRAPLPPNIVGGGMQGGVLYSQSSEVSLQLSREPSSTEWTPMGGGQQNMMKAHPVHNNMNNVRA